MQVTANLELIFLSEPEFLSEPGLSGLMDGRIVNVIPLHIKKPLGLAPSLSSQRPMSFKESKKISPL
jgi:hypothetical protein